MAVVSLTVAAVAAAKSGDLIRDDEVRGLQLRATGKRKTFYLYYRINGQERRPRIGEYGVLTINDARRIARKLLLQVAEGKDPSAQRQAGRDALSVADLVGIYRDTKLPAKKSKKDIAVILNHIVRHLGGVKVADLDIERVEKMHREMSKTTPIQANRTIAYVSALLKLAERLRARPLNSNFCHLIERNPETKRKRYLTPGEEAAAVGAALFRHMYTDRHESALFILLLMLTGARRGEIGNARLTDRQGAFLHLADHKTAGSAGDKVIHLPKPAIDLLDDPNRPQHHRVGFLVGVRSPRELWEEVRAECGCPDLRLHDLRHFFASIGVSMAGLSLSQVGGLLGHASPTTTKRYEHLLTAPAQAAANSIADNVIGVLQIEGTVEKEIKDEAGGHDGRGASSGDAGGVLDATANHPA